MAVFARSGIALSCCLTSTILFWAVQAGRFRFVKFVHKAFEHVFQRHLFLKELIAKVEETNKQPDRQIE